VALLESDKVMPNYLGAGGQPIRRVLPVAGDKAAEGRPGVGIFQEKSDSTIWVFDRLDRLGRAPRWSVVVRCVRR